MGPPAIHLTVVANNDDYYYTAKVKTRSTTGFTYNTQYGEVGKAITANGTDVTFWVAIGY